MRLVGDDRQLASVSAGGVLRDIDTTYGALNLAEVVWFKFRAEAQAGLALREGDPTGLAFYADDHRIHVGSDDTIIDWCTSARQPTQPADTHAMLTHQRDRRRARRTRPPEPAPAQKRPPASA